MPVRTASLFLGLLTLLVASLPSALFADEPAEIEYREDIVYGTGAGEELQLNIASPKDLTEPVPAVVVIHGGGWSGGKRQDMAFLAKRLAEHGYVSPTISYRLTPKHRHPAQIEDVKCAVRYLRAHADELHIDPERIGAIGVSAGAHLSMILGTMDASDGLEGEGGWADQSSKVQAVVSIVGPVNLVGDFPDISNEILERFVGAKPSEKVEELRQASPISHVNEGDAPMLLYFGTKDPLVPYDQAFQMTTALTEAGVPARVEMMVGAGHGWGGADMERTLSDSIEFFDRQLGKPSDN